jgi:hypothetical protein
MTIPITRKVLLIANILFWIVNFTPLCLPFYRLMPNFSFRQWGQFSYNLAAIMAVFYATAYFTKQWLNNFSLTVFKDLNARQRVAYLLNRYIYKILITFVAYLTVSLVLDNELFSQLHYEGLPLQFERRLSRLGSFMTNGPIYALLLFVVRKFNDMVCVVGKLKRENEGLCIDLFRVGHLYNTLKKETA